MTDPLCTNIVNGEACGKPGYSWSVEHGGGAWGEWRCVACYQQFLKDRNKLKAVEAIRALSSQEKRELLGLLTVKEEK